ncbi:hypothetical protein JG688_00011727 [Phytophthora aleatoria]|uniref:Cysteine protease n=1 Tax=Phytophthora aleatoria TaxID=2496075 RepID=A0A8J5INU5_9STRA|nr:hypothetical protein JG688_00011727 [Phytophthora aleatoria]
MKMFGSLFLAATAVFAPAKALTTDLPSSLSASEQQTWEAFVDYALDYEKSYRYDANDQDLVQLRFRAFATNLDRIQAHNGAYERGEHSFTLGLNELADLTDAEYKQRLSYRGRDSKTSGASETFIINNHKGKIDREKDYEYTAESKGVCNAKDDKAIGHFTSYANVTSGDEGALQAAIATKGVQAVAIDASSFTFQLYRHGVYSWPLCGNAPDALDHGVAAAGYGVYKKKDYWLVKNSWGDSWGMKGYIMMSRNKDNQCGIATDATYPIMTKEEEIVEGRPIVLETTEVASIMDHSHYRRRLEDKDAKAIESSDYSYGKVDYADGGEKESATVSTDATKQSKTELEVKSDAA